MNPKQKSALTKIFAVSGVVLLGGPILFMLITAAAVGIESGLFRFDFLMLAELFPVVALVPTGVFAWLHQWRKC